MKFLEYVLVVSLDVLVATFLIGAFIPITVPVIAGVFAAVMSSLA